MMIQGYRDYRHFDSLTSFIAYDKTGSFGIKANHLKFMTVLLDGLASFKVENNAQYQYLALPGGILYFSQNQLKIYTSRFFCGENEQHLQYLLETQLASEISKLEHLKSNLSQLDDEVINRIWQLGKF